MKRPIGASRARHRGTVLIVTMWIVLVLAGLVLVFTHTVRVESIASANYRSKQEAEAAARGALELARAIAAGDAEGDELFEAAAIGKTWSWMLAPNLDEDTSASYGLIDLSGRVNINTASQQMLLKLPGMTAELASAIVDWRDADDNVTPGGAESEYYLLLTEPYQCKNAPFETVAEVLLVKGATHEILFGEDRNQNGLLDTNENDGEGSAPDDNANGRLEHGLSAYITVHTTEPNESDTGERLININRLPNRRFSDLLREVVEGDRYFTVWDRALAGRPYQNVLQFYTVSGLKRDEFGRMVGQLTTTDARRISGRINVNVAPWQVLACLPELDQADAAALVSHREGGADLDSIAWVLDALPAEKATAIGLHITVRSSQYAADVVTVAHDGRGYARRRAVIDTLEGTPRILAHHDLAGLGWPLDRRILIGLRRGRALEQILTELAR